MKRKKLNLQDLHVDSFDTHTLDQEPRGTVKGHDYGANHSAVCTNGGHSCWWTEGPNFNCVCNYTQGACTWGGQETCAEYTCPQ